MKNLSKFMGVFSLVILGCVIFSTHAHADTLGTMQDYAIPSGSNPYSIVENTDGNLWFTQQVSNSNNVWKFNKSTSTFTSYSVTGMPSHIIVGRDGYVWTVNSGKFSKISSSGTVTEYSIPAEYNGGWNYFAAESIALGTDGNIWVFASSGSATDKVFKYRQDGTQAGKYTGFPDGEEFIEAVSDFANNRVWLISRGFTNPNYHSEATYFDMDGNTNTYNLGISSALTASTSSDGKFWAGGDGKKIQSITPGGTLSSVYTIPGTISGMFRLRSGPDGYLWATLSIIDKVVRIDEDGSMSNVYLSGYVPGGNGATTARPIGLTAGSDGNMWFTQYKNNRITKIGTGSNGTSNDTDGDGLSRSQEIQQGTSDFNADTDTDGLSDLIESTSYSNRNAVFCGTSCAYPNPLQKDIYIETDWMTKPSPGGYSMKPTSTQISKLVSAFSTQNIALHVDDGTFGGGNEVDYYSSIYFEPHTSAVDYFDYKEGGDGITSQFASNRYHIWHYMLLGYGYTEASGSSGVSYPGDDDSFISFGLVKDTFSYSSLDDAIAGTMIHELGHNLCLTDYNGGSARYTGQPASCRYAGIDNASSPYNSYSSAMNYTYQLSVVNYSSGINGTPNDHNDWVAARLQDFTQSNEGDATHGVNGDYIQNLKMKHRKAIPNMSNAEYNNLRVKL